MKAHSLLASRSAAAHRYAAAAATSVSNWPATCSSRRRQQQRQRRQQQQLRWSFVDDEGISCDGSWKPVARTPEYLALLEEGRDAERKETANPLDDSGKDDDE